VLYVNQTLIYDESTVYEEKAGEDFAFSKRVLDRLKIQAKLS